MDESIINYVKRKYNMLIGERTAEQVKMNIGAAAAHSKSTTQEVKGRDLVAGIPKVIVATSDEIREALRYVDASVEEKRSTPLHEELKDWLRGQCVRCNHCLPCPQNIPISDIITCLDYVEVYSGSRSSQQLNREFYASLQVKASECSECEICIERCPFDVDIIGKMFRAVDVFET